MAPIRRSASLRTSSVDFTTLTPPALPRPPAWICALTTHTGPPSCSAAWTASLALNAGMPLGVGTPNSRSTDLAWYSWMFMALGPPSACHAREGGHPVLQRRLAEQHDGHQYLW